MIVVRKEDGAFIRAGAVEVLPDRVIGLDWVDISNNTETVELISDAPADVGPGWVRLENEWLPPAPDIAALQAKRTSAVNAERDLRIRSPFTFDGMTFDYDAESQKRITGAASLAGFAMTLGGKLPGDLLWHGGETPFTWIAADNSLVQMDAATTFAFGQAAAAWESAHIFAARALKDAIEAAETAAELDAIDISANWPTV
jgi:hypothetical protein